MTGRVCSEAQAHDIVLAEGEGWFMGQDGVPRWCKGQLFMRLPSDHPHTAHIAHCASEGPLIAVKVGELEMTNDRFVGKRLDVSTVMIAESELVEQQ